MEEQEVNVTCEVCPDNSIPAFGGYVTGTLEGGEPMILVNINALMDASAQHDDVDFEREFALTVAQEVLHVMEDLMDREFDHSEIHAKLREAAFHRNAQELGEAMATLCQKIAKGNYKKDMEDREDDAPELPF